MPTNKIPLNQDSQGVIVKYKFDFPWLSGKDKFIQPPRVWHLAGKFPRFCETGNEWIITKTRLN
ncbi:MAG: hypothetical protein GY820_38610 [Gammaproteobacteria bacterium]|nr:hypothetical protein [Gammaproteobacteria bacterium]